MNKFKETRFSYFQSPTNKTEILFEIESAHLCHSCTVWNFRFIKTQLGHHLRKPTQLLSIGSNTAVHIFDDSWFVFGAFQRGLKRNMWFWYLLLLIISFSSHLLWDMRPFKIFKVNYMCVSYNYKWCFPIWQHPLLTLQYENPACKNQLFLKSDKVSSCVLEYFFGSLF